MEKVLSSLTKAFIPDVSDIEERYVTEEEANFRHYLRAKPLIEGAIGILAAQEDSIDEVDWSVLKLLEAFLDAMETGISANEGAVQKPLPHISIDKFKAILGDVGGAEVSIKFDAEGCLSDEKYHVGKNYVPTGSGEDRHFVPVPPPSEVKKNGKGKGKAA